MALANGQKPAEIDEEKATEQELIEELVFDIVAAGSASLEATLNTTLEANIQILKAIHRREGRARLYASIDTATATGAAFGGKPENFNKHIKELQKAYGIK